MRHKVENIFVNFLELLKVKHAKDFSNRYFNEHPHKYNLLGLSKILSDYGVEGLKTKRKIFSISFVRLLFIQAAISL